MEFIESSSSLLRQTSALDLQLDSQNASWKDALQGSTNAWHSQGANLAWDANFSSYPTTSTADEQVLSYWQSNVIEGYISTIDSTNAEAVQDSLTRVARANLMVGDDELLAGGTSNEVVFIDSGVEDYQSLVAGVKPETEVVVLDSKRDGVEQISEYLAGRSGISSLQIVSHGSSGSLQLGETQFSSDNLSSYKDNLQSWSKALTADADILLYGCDVAQGEQGAAFVQQLSELTGADVAASNDLTGSAALGGDWELEVETGAVESSIAIQSKVVNAYGSTLATFTVDTLTDESDGYDTGSKSLREAIASANLTPGNDTITFTGSVFTDTTADTITLTSGELSITDNLTIQGTGANNLTISGNNASRVFNITAADVTLNDMTITGGNSLLSGGGIFYNNSNGTLNVNNSTLSGNKSADEGGGVYSSGTLNVNNSTLSSNSAIGSGGIFSGGTLNVSNSTLSNNTAIIGSGGIFSSGTLNINNSTLSSNSVTNGGGGGIHSDGTLNVSNSTLSDNTATNGGGGILSGGTLKVNNSTLSGNSASNGGGIYSYYGTLDISNSTLSDNTATNGGGIYLDSEGGTSLNITNSTISGNQANNNGGGIYNSFDATITLTNATITNNVADSDQNNIGDGGGIYNSNSGGTTTLKNTIIAGNRDNTLAGGTINPDITGSFTSQGNNLIGISDGGTGFTNSVNNDIVGTVSAPIDPLLGPLANNGGSTFTHALLAGSPAINNGSNTDAPTTDQRGLPRLEIVDIGAYEVQPDNIAPVANNDEVATGRAQPVTISSASLLSNDTDGDNDDLSITSFTQPSNGTLVDNSNGTFTYTPGIYFEGTDSFTYTVSDGQGGTATSNVNLTVDSIIKVFDQTLRNKFLNTADFTASSIFDESFYLAQNPDVAQAVANGTFSSGFQHFQLYGQAEDRNPSIQFNNELYLAQNPDVAQAVASGVYQSGLEHFLAIGQNEPRDLKSLIFDEGFYLANNPDVAAAVQAGGFSSGFDHYVRYGEVEGRNPSELFDEAFYLANNSDVAQAVSSGGFSSGIDHFLRFGIFEGRNPTRLFDNSRYLADNLDVASAVANNSFRSGFDHYLRYGQSEDRQPNLQLFEEGYYRAQNPDVDAAVQAGAFSSGFDHFILYGQTEGRNPSELFNEGYYLANNSDVAAAVQAGGFRSGFDHYVRYGRAENRSGVGSTMA